MPEAREIICIICPKGCHAELKAEKESIKMKGEICKKGKAYLEQEFVEPMRLLTTTVVVTDSQNKRIPVRSAKAIPKTALSRCMEELARISVCPPIKIGQVIIPNVLDTGVDIIASDDLLT